MFDGTLARQVAGHMFRRADTARDERGEIPTNVVEQFLRGAISRFQRRQVLRQEVHAFGSRIAPLIEARRALSDEALREWLHLEAAQLRGAPRSIDLQVEAFATVGEACRRVFGYCPHNVQYMGARTLLAGELAEMQTGEGKTLVAGLAATILAASGCSVHVVSTNDYLAKRDAEEMQILFGFFGLRAASVVEGMEPDERKAAYRHPICYVSGKELVFDYLKDRLSGHGHQPSKLTFVKAVLAGSSAGEDEPLIPSLHCVIVDEADSVLIDEARTPLIISREAEGLYEPEIIRWAIEQVGRMENGLHFVLRPDRSVELRPLATQCCEPLPFGVRRIWSAVRWQSTLLRQAITACHAFIRDQHYIVTEGKVQIVDESTGRVMADRTWEQGLHQMIECKEGLDQTGNRETLAKLTFQRFFRRYYLLSGLSGTVSEARHELWAVYGLRVRAIPPNRPNKRRYLPALCAATSRAKWSLVSSEVADAVARGQPVLVGTRSVEASEALSAALTERGIEHVVLNARQDKNESEIIALAGLPGQVTVATNMAGRGTDIKLNDAARQAGGLHVILTEFHESPRVDRQLFGRSGRQGDPGSVRAIVSADDALFTQKTPLASMALRACSSEIMKRHLLAVSRFAAQWISDRDALRARKHTLRQDRSLHKLLGFAGKVL